MERLKGVASKCVHSKTSSLSSSSSLASPAPSSTMLSLEQRVEDDLAEEEVKVDPMSLLLQMGGGARR